jgi:hypothetical protein
MMEGRGRGRRKRERERSAMGERDVEWTARRQVDARSREWSSGERREVVGRGLRDGRVTREVR